MHPFRVAIFEDVAVLHLFFMLMHAHDKQAMQAHAKILRDDVLHKFSCSSRATYKANVLHHVVETKALVPNVLFCFRWTLY